MDDFENMNSKDRMAFTKEKVKESQNKVMAFIGSHLGEDFTEGTEALLCAKMNFDILNFFMNLADKLAELDDAQKESKEEVDKLTDWLRAQRKELEG